MSVTETNGALADLKKRRGAIRGSITRLVNRIEDIEDHPNRPDSTAHATQYESKLTSLDKDSEMHKYFHA